MLRGLVDPERPLTLGGLDVGFSPRKRTAGLARLADGKCFFSCCLGSDAEAELARYGIYDLIAIDGPILPDACKNLTMVRPVERLFSSGLFQKRCKPGMSHVRGTGISFREAAGFAASFANRLTSDSRVRVFFPKVRDGAVVEAFPNAFLGVCLEDEVFRKMPILSRGQKFDWLYYHWREKRRFKNLSGLTLREQFYLEETFNRTAHHEHRAALVCVLTALLVSRNRFTAVGEEGGGWFFLPPWECWAGWAQEAVENTASALNREEARIRIVKSGVQK
jgi:hypothetical protein